MHSKLPKYALIFALIIFSIPRLAHAVESVAVSFEIQGSNVPDGSIIKFSDDVYTLSDTPYEQALFGVVNDSAPLSLEDANLTNFRLVSSSGESKVLVNGQNGDIVKGDYLTSSFTQGVGMKATRSGFVIGTALESANFTNPDDQASILVYVNPDAVFISDFRSNLLEAIKGGFSSPLLDPIVSLRYILAIIITGISFALGFATFSRISKNSVEAVGRNPLADKAIKRVVFMNFLMAFAILATGLGISYLILAL